jgi:hypothetical protein
MPRITSAKAAPACAIARAARAAHHAFWPPTKSILGVSDGTAPEPIG